MNSLGLMLIVFVSLVILALPRQWAALGILAGVCYIPMSQRVEVGGFNFTAIRIVLLVALIRTMVRCDFKHFKFNRIDKALFSYVICVTALYSIRIGTSEALIYQLGVDYDIVLAYFTFRVFLIDYADVQDVLPKVAILIVPMSAFMIFEASTGKNLFEALGIDGGSTVRDGHVRAQAAFLHAITAGVFGATLIPLFVGAFFSMTRRGLAVLGLIAATIITMTSHSSGPLMAFLTGLVALGFWSFRQRMRTVRWGIIGVLVCFQLVMKAPIWYIFAKLSDFIGGDGWHRSYLINQAIVHFGDWWLMGTSNTGDWMATMLTDGTADMTNQYLRAGIDGGLLSMILFVMIPVRCFQELGTTMSRMRELSGGVFSETAAGKEKLLWCVGCCLVAHVATFFSVNYWDQMRVAWLLLPAIICATVKQTDDEIVCEFEHEDETDPVEPRVVNVRAVD